MATTYGHSAPVRPGTMESSIARWIRIGIASESSV